MIYEGSKLGNSYSIGMIYMIGKAEDEQKYQDITSSKVFEG